ncbi:hypothetical protein I7I48_04342 [Histoplasma ohiense]|nr:hypothetical protein I7I48_04342 [Histoplasma ohiense (nom. inval.)]
MTAITPAILTTGTTRKRATEIFVVDFFNQQKVKTDYCNETPTCTRAVQDCLSLPYRGDTGRHIRGSRLLSTSLHDIETIPMRGFLTRRIFLKRVYSFTFEEQRENSCSHRSREVPETRCANRHSKSLSSKKCRAVNTSKGTRFLPEDDKLLIELDEWNLPWSRILEYFTRRSKSSLQFRYVRSSRIEESKAVLNTMAHSPVSGRDSSRKAFDLV